jgi:hypothetical protein
MSSYSPSRNCLDKIKVSMISFGFYLSDSGVKEEHKQLEVPEQPHSPFMIADGIVISLYLIQVCVIDVFTRANDG